MTHLLNTFEFPQPVCVSQSPEEVNVLKQLKNIEFKKKSCAVFGDYFLLESWHASELPGLYVGSTESKQRWSSLT